MKAFNGSRPASETGPLRILHIVQTMTLGGLESRVSRLAHGLDPKRFRVGIASLRHPKGTELSLPPHIVHDKVYVPPGLHFMALMRLVGYIRHHRIDIVHTHNWATQFYGVLAGRLAGVAMVFHGEHGLENTRVIPWKRRAAQYLLARLCDRIVAVNESVGKVVRTAWKLSEAKVVVVPNGVDLQRFGTVNPDPSVFTIGTVGRHVEVKDFPCLLRGFALFLEKIAPQPARLCLVGGGPLEEKHKTLARDLGIAASCDFPGETLNPESWYNHFSVYANTSSYEGMSNTLLEAMACRLPVIASDVDGNRDWLGGAPGACFFTSGDAAALAEVLFSLYQNEATRQTMGSENRKLIDAKYDNRDFIKKYSVLYESVWKSKGLPLARLTQK